MDGFGRRPQELIERYSGAPMRQIDGPGVVERHSGKKRVNSQRQKFELASRDLRHGVPSLLLMVNVATPILAAGIKRKIEHVSRQKKLTKCGLRPNFARQNSGPRLARRSHADIIIA